MFSQTALIQFLFANETDDYFWDGLFRGDLNRYLFFKLHEKYDLTYFIDMKNDRPCVINYGENNAKSYKKILIQNSEKSLIKWIIEQLERKKFPCAIVCRLELFCSLFENEKKYLSKLYKSYQEDNLNGTIILISSNNADKNKDYLLSGPVFEYLNESSVLSLRAHEVVENMYLSLKSNKQEACVFLNNYTRERINELVTYVSFEYKNRYLGKNTIRLMSNYLTRYLNCADMRMREHKLFIGDYSLVCPSYKEIYNQLQIESVWTDLYQRSMDYEKNRSHELDDYMIDSIDKKTHFVYYDDSIQTKCMKLCVPAAIYGIYDDSTVTNLGEIYEKTSSSRNQPINPAVSERISSLLIKLHNARHSSDGNTCSRIVTAILCCVGCLYVEEENSERVISKIESLDVYIDLSRAYFEYQKLYNPSSILAEAQRKKIEFIRAKLQTFDQTVSVIKSNLIESDITGRLESIVHEIEIYSSNNRSRINGSNNDHGSIVAALCDFGAKV